MAGLFGERPIVGTGVAVAVVPILPSRAARCVMLNVPASCVSDTVGVASSIEAPVKIPSGSSIEMS